jgi:Na+-transporting NADH:ubiquinone oxidoreductase subunit C
VPDAPAPVRRESATRTLVVTLAVCLVCSVFVSATAVLLRPYREAHLRRERDARIREILQRTPGIQDLLQGEGASALEAHVYDLETGAVEPSLDVAAYDAVAAARDPARSVAIPPERDLARLERRERYAPLYVVRRGGRLEVIVLPIRGRGYGSVIHGYLALAGDADRVLGITFTEHGETPGVGSEIETDDWRGLWVGKRVRDDAGEVRIRVVDPDAPPEGDPRHRVDGIGGATRSSQGVGNMVRFWVGEDGFGPTLRRLREGS